MYKIDKMEFKLIDLHVSLIDTSPLVWRKIRFLSKSDLKVVRKAINRSMNWTENGIKSHEITNLDGVRLSEKLSIDEVMNEFSSELCYEIRNGSGVWRHKIKFIRRISTKQSEMKYGGHKIRLSDMPVCLSGRFDRPPQWLPMSVAKFNSLRLRLNDPRDDEYKLALTETLPYDDVDRDFGSMNGQLFALFSVK